MNTITPFPDGPAVSRIALGCMGLGGGWDDTPLTAELEARADALIGTALDHGINLFDHADLCREAPTGS